MTKFSNEHKRKLSESIKASWTPQRREALRQKRLGSANPFFGKHHYNKVGLSGEANPFFGKHHTEEAKKRQREERRGRTRLLLKYGITPEQYAENISAGQRWCSGCKKFVLPTSGRMGKVDSRSSTRNVLCHDCYWAVSIRKKFGVDPEWYKTKIAEQNHGCGICGSRIDDSRFTKGKFCIDHNHVTKQTRGLLCGLCNSALARIEEIPDWTVKALAYLTKYATA